MYKDYKIKIITLKAMLNYLYLEYPTVTNRTIISTDVASQYYNLNNHLNF